MIYFVAAVFALVFVAVLALGWIFYDWLINEPGREEREELEEIATKYREEDDEPR